MSFENDGTETRQITAQVQLQSEAGIQQFGLLKFPYSGGSEEVQINYVRVRKSDGRIITTSAEDVQDMAADITRAAPMYTDLREKHVPVKGLGVGDVLEFDVKTHVSKPLVPGQFWFDYAFMKDGVILDEQLEVSVPKDRAVNVKSTDVKPAIREEGARRVYLWKTANPQRKPADEEEAPSEVPPPPVQISTFRSWEEVGRWWAALEQERVAPTPEIRAKAAELTKDARTDADKIKALYDYVALRFRYIGISFGIGRYQPHAAAEVLNNAYGDCKDKHTLLASLLKAAGLDAYPALINSARKIDPDVPSPGQFDHVITAVPQGKDLIWLDTTTEIAPFAFLMAPLRDKQALAIPTDAPPSLMKTPADPPFKNSLVFDLDGKLDEAGTLDAKVQRSDRGDLELIWRSAFRQVPQPNWKDLVQRISYMSGFGGDVSEVTASPPEATREPFRYSYKYLRKEYTDWVANKRITPPLNPCTLTEIKDSKSKEPLKLGGPGEYVCKSRIEMPKGYSPQLLPPVDVVRDFAEYHSSSSFKDGVFVAERRLTITVRELPTSRREDYKSLQKAVSDDENLHTSFSMASGDVLARADQMSADELNTAAANLLDQKKDFSTARDLLLKATTKDPNHKWAWNNLGRAYAALGSPEEAIKAYKMQIEVNPNDEYAYKNLGGAYSWTRRYDDAIAAYRKAAEVNPRDKEIYGSLGRTLGAMEKWDEAAQAYEKSAALNPDQPYTYTQWARALMKTGKTEAARKQLDRALELDSSPMTLNNVAWELADAGVDLDNAEEQAKSAVSKTAANLRGPLSFDVPADYSQRLYTLGSFLDTLGWVYFKRGELERAEPYLICAHELSMSHDIAEHLALLRARQDKFEDALRYYVYSRMAPGWSGRSDKELEKYFTKKSGGTAQMMTNLTGIMTTLNDEHAIAQPLDSFTWPEKSTATRPAAVAVAVVTDKSGAVTDAQIISGDAPFRDAALTDARKLRLPPIKWPGEALETVRTISFLYVPGVGEKRVKAWWALGKPPVGTVTVASPDGNHVISVPASLLQAFQKDTNSDASVGSSGSAATDFMTFMQQGEILQRAGKLDEAISKFREATQAEPDCTRCRHTLADALASGGYRTMAILEYKELVRIEPSNPEDHFMLGAQLEAEGATKANSGYHFDAKSQTSRPASSTLSKSARDDYEAALEQYRLAHELAPDNKGYNEAYERLRRQLKRP